MAQRILQPGEIAQLTSSEIPFLRLPDRASLFAERAARLRHLASGHAMQGYLEFVARLADAQHWALQGMSSTRLPTPQQIERSREHGMPPLDVNTHLRDPAWCDLLRRILRKAAQELEGMPKEIVLRLDGERDELYEAQASKLLAGVMLGLDLAYAPLIGAALQVYWVDAAARVGRESFGRIEAATVCPVCGSRPLASVVRVGGAEAGHRYLHCSLCAAEWHMVRVKCTSCESTKGIHYQGIENGSKAVLAECCDECDTYLKVLHQDRDPLLEPTADDLASTALDLLVAETGKLRSGQNLLLIHGEA